MARWCFAAGTELFSHPIHRGFLALVFNDFGGFGNIVVSDSSAGHGDSSQII
jgi:hypothetical protein